MTPLYTEKDLPGLLKIGRVVALTIQEMAAQARAGMTTAELDAIGKRVLDSYGARSAPILTYEFPGVNCISINDEAAHGIPGGRVIQPGDLVKIDVSAELDGYFGDAATTVGIEPVAPLGQRLMQTAYHAFQQGIAQVRPGQPISAIGKALEAEVRKAGFGVLCQLPGHGIGRKLHEDLSIPMCYRRSEKTPLKAGMVFTIEPHISALKTSLRQADDQWTLLTLNQSIVAAYEHTVFVTPNGAILTTQLDG